MANEKLVLSPTTRKLITEIEPNNNAIPILDPLVFETSTGRSMSLSVTDPIDTAAITGASIVSMSLSAVDVIDSASISADLIVSCSMAVTDGIDTSVISGDVIVSLSLSVIEPVDIAALSGDVDISAELDVTETLDTALIYVGVAVPRDMALNVTESQDHSVIRAAHRTAPRTDYLRGGGVSRHLYIEEERKPLDDIRGKISASENRDSSVIFAHAVPISFAEIKMTERRDGIDIDVDGDHDRRYRADEIRLLMMVA